MTQSIQTSKNLELSAKVAKYIAKNPDSIKNIPDKSSYIVFSSNKELNQANSRLVKTLKKEGRNVVKVQEVKSKKGGWKFTLAV